MRARTCFASAVCCSDAFLDLPATVQALYYQLAFYADNDGAVDGLRRLARSVGATAEDIDAMEAAGLLLWVDDVPFIADWWVNNRTASTRYVPGSHVDEVAKLEKLENRRYALVSAVQKHSDAEASPEQCSPSANIIKFNPNKTNQNESNPSEADGKEAASSPAFVPCPECGMACAAVTEHGITRGWCPEHGDFADGEAVAL